MKRVLVTGATGFVGRRLVPVLDRDEELEVRCLVRDPDAARRLPELAGAELCEGDLTDPPSYERALEEVVVAYYLVHLMGADADYPERETEAAGAFGRAAQRAGVERVVYLGGLGDEDVSRHLRSRHDTAVALRDQGPPLTYFRAAMIVGQGSESYALLRGVVEGVPVLPSAEWLEAETQPIGIRDVVAYLRAAAHADQEGDLEVQIGGPRRYRQTEVVDAMAAELGRRPRPRIPIPGTTPELVAAAAAGVTKGSAAIAREIAKGVIAATVVTDPEPARRFGVRPESLAVSIQRALEEEEKLEEGHA